MPDFKKANRFNSGGRPSFGDRRGTPTAAHRFDAPRETFKTNCSTCSKVCEVPFKPNGKKPVYCRDCFVRDDERGNADRFPKKNVGVEDPRLGAIQKELKDVHAKIDALVAALQGAAYSSILASAQSEHAHATTPVKTKSGPKKKSTKKNG